MFWNTTYCHILKVSYWIVRHGVSVFSLVDQISYDTIFYTYSKKITSLSLPTLMSIFLFCTEVMTLTAWPKCTSLIPKSAGVILYEEKKTHLKYKQMNEIKQVIWIISYTKWYSYSIPFKYQQYLAKKKILGFTWLHTLYSSLEMMLLLCNGII